MMADVVDGDFPVLFGARLGDFGAKATLIYYDDFTVFVGARADS
jgi:hypothetical protein